MQKIQIKVSKNGSLIPILNGVYLHSMYNPEKEASSFIQNNFHNIEGKKNFLVLGLGFAYHVDALIQQLQGSDYFIYVLEPCTELIEAFYEKRPLFDNKVVIKELSNLDSLYKNLDFADFLSEKPVILPHSTSFNMNQDIFKKFINYTASSFIDDYKEQINEELRYKFENISKDWSLIDYLQHLNKTSSINDTNDILLLALNEIINESSELR